MSSISSDANMMSASRSSTRSLIGNCTAKTGSKSMSLYDIALMGGVIFSPGSLPSIAESCAIFCRDYKLFCGVRVGEPCDFHVDEPRCSRGVHHLALGDRVRAFRADHPERA